MQMMDKPKKAFRITQECLDMAVAKVEKCLLDVSGWMNENMLMCNEDKAEWDTGSNLATTSQDISSSSEWDTGGNLATTSQDISSSSE